MVKNMIKKEVKKEYRKAWKEGDGYLTVSTPFGNCICMGPFCNNCYYYKNKDWKKENIQDMKKLYVNGRCVDELNKAVWKGRRFLLCYFYEDEPTKLQDLEYVENEKTVYDGHDAQLRALVTAMRTIIEPTEVISSAKTQVSWVEAGDCPSRPINNFHCEELNAILKKTGSKITWVPKEENPAWKFQEDTYGR